MRDRGGDPGRWRRMAGRGVAVRLASAWQGATALAATALAATLLAATLLGAQPALALVGSHGASIGTFDVRASSLGLTLDHHEAGGAQLDVLTYHTAFTSTTGRLSSQFGIHGIHLVDKDGRSGWGMSAGAVTMFTLPAERFRNGVPRSAVRYWFGLVPTAAFGAIYGRVWLPMTFGGAWTLSPVQWLSFTPWVELAGGLDANADVHEAEVSLSQGGGDNVTLSQDDVKKIIDKSLSWNARFGFAWRTGLEVAFHMGDRFDIALRGGAGKLGNEVAWNARVALIFHWDDVVPALLPSSCPTPRVYGAPEVPLADPVTPGAR